MSSGVLVLGAGGHGKVVADILLRSGVCVVGFLDDEPALWGSTRLGLPVLGPLISYMQYHADGLALGVGAIEARRQIVARLGESAWPLWRQVIHPRAIIAPSVRLGRGVTVTAGAIVNPDAALSKFAIANTGATVDHDCVVREYAHIAPGAHLAGGVSIGRGTLIGIGAVVLPGCTVGDRTVVGAGAVVVRDVPDGVTVVGTPARAVSPWKSPDVSTFPGATIHTVDIMASIDTSE